MTQHRDLFTPRQLVALGTFSDLVEEARRIIRKDALASYASEERAAAYADAVATYLAFAVNRLLMLFSTLCPWVQILRTNLMINMFARQAIPMVWDFGGDNPFSQAASWAKSLQPIPTNPRQTSGLTRVSGGCSARRCRFSIQSAAILMS